MSKSKASINNKFWKEFLNDQIEMLILHLFPILEKKTFVFPSSVNNKISKKAETQYIQHNIWENKSMKIKRKVTFTCPYLFEIPFHA